MRVGIEHSLGGCQADTLEGLDNPWLDNIREVIEEDVAAVAFAINVDLITCEQAGKLDVGAILADGERYLFGTHEYFGGLVLFVDMDLGDGCRGEGALDKQAGVGGVGDDVKVLATQFTYDAVDTSTLDTDASAYWIDAIVVGLDSNLGTFAWETNNLDDADGAVGYLGNLLLHEVLEEDRSGA